VVLMPKVKQSALKLKAKLNDLNTACRRWGSRSNTADANMEIWSKAGALCQELGRLKNMDSEHGTNVDRALRDVFSQTPFMETCRVHHQLLSNSGLLFEIKDICNTVRPQMTICSKI